MTDAKLAEHIIQKGNVYVRFSITRCSQCKGRLVRKLTSEWFAHKLGCPEVMGPSRR